MKKFLIVLLSGIITLSITAQTITITFHGTNANRNYQVNIDESSYFSNSVVNSSNTSVKKEITLSNQQVGSHKIEVYRQRNNSGTTSNGNVIYSNTFQLREEYDMDISLQGNGQVKFTEKRIKNRDNRSGQVIPPMEDATFKTLLQSVRSQYRQSSKIAAERNAFLNKTNYFTTSQVRQLISLIYSEANRLALAKLAYSRVTDPVNYTQLFDVFNSESSQTQLNVFIKNNPNNNNSSNTDNYKSPIGSYQFNQLLQKANNYYNQADRIIFITNTINNTTGYFSTSQIRQFLSIVNTEADRLAIAKISYAKISDPASFSSLYDLFNNQDSRDELNNFINGNVNPKPTSKTAMADYQFNQLLQTINNQYSQASKVNEVSNSFNTSSNNFFTTAQIRKLLSLISTENDRLILAKSSYLRVTDQTNFTSLYDLFYSQSSRTDLNNYVIQNGGKGSNIQYNTKTPMADAAFSQVLQKASNHFFPWDKERDVREAFNNSTYYFSTSQIRQLLYLVAAEPDKLELAKLSWSRVTDPSYFMQQLSDLFTAQANKDALNAYIQAHPF